MAWINCWPDPKKLRSFKEFDLYWKGAFAEAERSGYRLQEYACGDQLPMPRLEKILRARNVPGILIPPHGLTPPDWADFHWEEFCAVRFGFSVATPRAHIVTADQLGNGLLAFQNIRKKGYRHIGMVSPTVYAHKYWRFSAGYVFGQMAADIRPLLPRWDSSRGIPTTGNASSWLG